MADAHPREVRTHEVSQGRLPARPGKIPRPGWRNILLRVKQEQSDDNLAIIAAGVAFYWLLAVFPAMAGLIAIYGLVTEPQQVQEQIQTVSRLLPQQAQAVIANQATRIAEQSADTLQLAAVLGFLGALWSSAKGVKALMQSLNIAYGEEEERGFFKLNGLALLLTLGALILGVVALGLVVALSPLLGNIGLGFAARTIVNILRWPVLAALAIFALGVVYRYAPDRERSEWRWVNVGAVTATVLWLAASGLFSWYVSNFGNYNETYGSVGAIIILLMWFLITAYVILLGAELNSEIERQTSTDTTDGRRQPMGRRGAYAADTVGEAP